MMNKYIWSILLLALCVAVSVSLAAAQEDEEEERPFTTIRGAVYEDVTGDGRCVNTGVPGEAPVPDINVEFVSSDEQTVITLHTGSDGTYGLVGVGYSVWRVTARPDPATWVVTSENPKYVAILPEGEHIQTDINFCIQRGVTGVIGVPGVINIPGATGVVVTLPESGAAGLNHHSADTAGLMGLSQQANSGALPSAVAGLIILGLGFFFAGLGLEWRRRQSL